MTEFTAFRLRGLHGRDIAGDKLAYACVGHKPNSTRLRGGRGRGGHKVKTPWRTPDQPDGRLEARGKVSAGA